MTRGTRLGVHIQSRWSLKDKGNLDKGLSTCEVSRGLSE